MPTLPFAVFTKRLDVPTSRFELIRRFSLVWATMLEVVRVLSEPMSRLDVKVTSDAWVMLDVVRVLSEPMSRLDVKVTSDAWVILDVVRVPVTFMLESTPLGGSMAPAVNVVPAAITILELMVTGEAPTILDVVRVPVIQESPTT